MTAQQLTSVRFGVRVSDLPEAPQTPVEAIAVASGHGASALQFPEVTWISATLDRDVLRKIAHDARAAGLAPSATLGAVSASFPDRARELNAIGDGDLLRGIRRVIRAVGGTGIDVLHLTIGTLEDRFLTEPRYADQLEAAAAMLAEAAATAEESGIVLVLKTHEEMSSVEAVHLVGEVGSDALRLGFSPVNLLVLMEHPTAAAARVSELTHTLFIDDAAVAAHPDGLRRVMRPLGEGDVDWYAIRALYRAGGGEPEIVIDIHRAEFTMPFLRTEWLPFHEHVTTAELIALLRGARKAELQQDVDPRDRFRAAVEVVRDWRVMPR